MKVTEGQTNEPKAFASLYWDCQNVRVSSHQAKCLLNFASDQGILVIKRAYAYWRHENQGFEKALYDHGFDCLNVPSVKNNSVDYKLIDDCKSAVLNNPCLNINTVILVSGDKDFAGLVRELRDQGKKVIIFAQPQVSKRLIELADEFYLVSQIPLCEQIG